MRAIRILGQQLPDGGGRMTFGSQHRYRYRFLSKGDVNFDDSGMRMDVAIDLASGVDRGLGLLYNDEDEVAGS